MEVTQCPLRFVPAFHKDVLSPLPSSITLPTVFLTKLPEITQGIELGVGVHVPDLAYADDIVIFSSSVSKM